MLLQLQCNYTVVQARKGAANRAVTAVGNFIWRLYLEQNARAIKLRFIFIQ